jgi:dihydroxy-acid dehydratase
VEIDIPNHKVNVRVSDEEFKARAKERKIPEPRVKSGWLARYSSQVSSASAGAVMNFNGLRGGGAQGGQ